MGGLARRIDRTAKRADRLTSVRRPGVRLDPSARLVRYINWTRASIVVIGIAWSVANRSRNSKVRPPIDRG